MLIGNLGADPEVRSVQNGGKVVTLSVATSESWKDKSTGEKKERTEWHRVVIWNEGIAGVAEKYCKKGGKVYIEGELQTRKWQDQDGKDRWSTEVVLTGFSGKLTLLGDAGGGGGVRDANDNSSRPGNNRPGADRAGQGDDSIPF